MKNKKLKSEERNKLIVDHLWIVDYLARKFSGTRNISFEDLRSVGGIGLIKAVDNFDETMGTSFSTYATLMIQGEIRHYLRDKYDVLRIPRKYVEHYRIIQDAMQHILNEKKRIPTVAELVKMTGLKREDIIESLEAAYAKFPLSLDEPISKNGEKLKVHDTISTPSDDAQNVIQRITINTMLQKLEPVERKSIVLKYQYDMTYNEIAEKLGIKPGKVARSVQTGLKKLKQYLTEEQE